MKKAIIIASAVIAMLIAVYTSIKPFYNDNNADFIIAYTIIMAIILVFSLVLPIIKLSRPMQVFLLIISVLFLLFSLFLIGIGLHKIMTGGFPPPSEIDDAIMLFMFSAVVFISALTYIIRVLQPSGKTILIVIGFACAGITAAGMMKIGQRNITIHKTRLQLHDKDWQVRHEAIWELVHLGAKEAIPEITKLLQDNDVNCSAVRALGDIGAKESIPEITKLLQADEPNVRENTVNALGKLGAKESIPEITRLLQDNNWKVRVAAINTLYLLDAQESIPAIARLLQDDNIEVRGMSIVVLAELGDKKYIPEIKKFLNDDTAWMRKTTEWSLKQLGVSQEEIDKAKKGK